MKSMNKLYFIPALLLLGNVVMRGMTAAINDSLILARQTAACPASSLVPDTLTMVFIGDIMLHSAQIENTARPGPVEWKCLPANQST